MAEELLKSKFHQMLALNLSVEDWRRLLKNGGRDDCGRSADVNFPSDLLVAVSSKMKAALCSIVFAVAT